MSFPIENIPLELRELHQWVCWKRITRGDDPKPTKVPYLPCGTKPAKSDDPDTWCSFDEARAGLTRGVVDGIGFVFSPDDPYFGLDLDKVIDPQSSSILPWTDEQRKCEHWSRSAPDPEQILSAFSDRCYCEKSPSGTGIHIIGRGTLPRGRHLGNLEIYKLGRFFTVTGNVLSKPPEPLADCSRSIDALMLYFDAKPKPKNKPKAPRQQPHHPSAAPPSIDQIIAKIKTAQNAALFDQLYSGSTSGYESHSEADAALCGIISFWSAGDPLVIDSVFRQSKLYRDKWDEQHSSDGRTYGQMTIDNSLLGCNEFYDWSGGGKPAPKTYSLGAATFIVKSTSKTATKTTVTIELVLDGKSIDLVTFTTAASNRDKAAKAIKQRCFCGDDPTTIQQIDNVLGVILVDANNQPEHKSEQKPAASKEIHQILEEIIPPMVDLAYRADDGKAYSRTIGDEISKGGFISYCATKSVVDQCSKAFDAPRDSEENVNRMKLIPAVKLELEVLWGHLIGQLEEMEHASLGDDDRAIKDLRQLVIKLWTSPCTMGVHAQKMPQGGQSAQMMTRLSVASRVVRMTEDRVIDYSDRWHRIHETFAAFYREHYPIEGGEMVPLLAMQYDLFDQVGVRAKIGKGSFKSLTVRHKITEATDSVNYQIVSGPAAGVPARMTNGGRLIVLSQLMTSRILSRPMSDAVKQEIGSDKINVPH